MERRKIVVGVLALQGSYHEHLSHLKGLFTELADNPKYTNFQFEARGVKNVSDLENLSGLIFPGGESTTMSILLQRNNILIPIQRLVQVERLPCWGTCAGLILLSNEIINTKINLSSVNESSLKYRVIGGLDIQIERNSFGRQVDSFSQQFKLTNYNGTLKNEEFNCIFIRAPIIKKLLTREKPKHEEFDKENGIVHARKLDNSLSKNPPTILLEFSENGSHNKIVSIRQDNIFGTSFHPELVKDDYRMHKWFIDEFVL
jgi:pyridoxal 5'-phosphate synthase pdxT subunit